MFKQDKNELNVHICFLFMFQRVQVQTLLPSTTGRSTVWCFKSMIKSMITLWNVYTDLHCQSLFFPPFFQAPQSQLQVLPPEGELRAEVLLKGLNINSVDNCTFVQF